MADLIVIGGGLAGSEAAWQAAERGITVDLYEMRPTVKTGAHVSQHLAELVCSNSLGSKISDRAPGILKNELRMLNSLLINCAEETAVPAGGALAVDREKFAKLVTKRVETHSKIRVIREEVIEIPEMPTIIASGPLTSRKLSHAIMQLTGSEHLYFFDAISPIVTLESINMDIAFRASRYDRGSLRDGDYINCPLNKVEYELFINELVNAKRIQLKSFEKEINTGVRAGMHNYFEGCLPIEIMAKRGFDTLSYGPMRPVGLMDHRTNIRPAAVVQLRQDDLAGKMYNLVGFQTNLTFTEQRRVLRMIPGLENAKFVRYGQMHRNTFILSPKLLKPTLQFYNLQSLFFAGQITGIEGYAGNIAAGLVAGINSSLTLMKKSPLVFPEATMIGALCNYIANASPAVFQPMKANLGILPPLERAGKRISRRQRAEQYAKRSAQKMKEFMREHC